MKKFWKSPWTITIASAFLAPIATIIIDAMMKKPILSTLWSVIKALWGWIVAFLTFDLKVWWVLLGIGVIAIILISIAKISDSKSKNKEPSFLNYTKDSVLGYTWEWKYSKNYDGTYTINDLHPVCSKCGMILKQCGVYNMQMKCLRCNATKQWEDSFRYDAQMLIEDNIRRNYLKNQ